MKVAPDTQTSVPVTPKFQGRGFSFEPTLDHRWGSFDMVEGEADIRQAIRIIVGTAKGERVIERAVI